LPSLETQIESAVARIKALIPIGEDTKDYVARQLELQLESISSTAPMGVIPSSLLSNTRMYASARMSAELIDQPKRLVGRPEGVVDLGTIEWILRPALPLSEGLLEPVAGGPWRHVRANIVEKEEKGVCRLDISMPGYDSIHIGTGFTVGTDPHVRNILTNAHVVEEAIRLGWTKSVDIRFGCDFKRYSMGCAEDLSFLATEYRMHPLYDLALLYFQPDDFKASELEPLTLSDEAPDPTIGADVGVLGHPSFDSRLDPFPKYFGFGNEFGIKRFSPGRVRVVEHREWRGANIEAMLHDASTLSGSSGSCILDLSTKKVVGLHFGGWPISARSMMVDGTDVLAQLFQANGAVPLWKLRRDSLLQPFFK